MSWYNALRVLAVSLWALCMAYAVAMSTGCGDPAPSGGYVAPAPGFSAQHARALRASGFKDAKPADYSIGGCGDGDSFLNSAGFEANGVRGNVCCGWLKGCVVRTQ